MIDSLQDACRSQAVGASSPVLNKAAGGMSRSAVVNAASALLGAGKGAAAAVLRKSPTGQQLEGYSEKTPPPTPGHDRVRSHIIMGQLIENIT